MLNTDMSLQKLCARLPLLNTPYEHSYPQWPELDVIVTADRFLPPPFKVTNITDALGRSTQLIPAEDQTPLAALEAMSAPEADPYSLGWGARSSVKTGNYSISGPYQLMIEGCV